MQLPKTVEDECLVSKNNDVGGHAESSLYQHQGANETNYVCEPSFYRLKLFSSNRRELLPYKAYI